MNKKEPKSTHFEDKTNTTLTSCNDMYIRSEIALSIILTKLSDENKEFMNNNSKAIFELMFIECSQVFNDATISNDNPNSIKEAVNKFIEDTLLNLKEKYESKI